MVDISFVTVTMDNMNTIEPLLCSFYKTIGSDIRYEYIVVDNCSVDGTPEYIERNYPAVKLIRTNEIKGFAENNNMGINLSTGRIVALINPDIIFLPNSVEQVLTYMNKENNVGLVGPKLLNKDGSLQDSARRFLTIKTAFLRLVTLGNDQVPIKSIQRYLKSYDSSRTVQVVDWVIGAVMFVKRDALKTAGLLDTKFFLYIEDQDWCFQMWKNNWTVAYLTTSQFIHDHQRSSVKRINKKTVWHVQSILYFLRKNYLSVSRKRPVAL